MTLNELALTIMCARCKARPGERCVSVHGIPVGYAHTARTKPLFKAWDMGYSDARRGLIA